MLNRGRQLAFLLPDGAFTYGEIRDLWRLLNQLGRSQRLEVEARVEDHEVTFQHLRSGRLPLNVLEMRFTP